MAIYTHKLPCDSTNHSFSEAELLVSNIDKVKQLTLLRTKSQLNKVIVGKNNSPDHLAINIYWDTLRSWYIPSKLYNKDGNIIHTLKLKTKGIYLDYTKLSQVHGVSKEIIRQKLVKLEELGLVNRSFQHTETIRAKSFNQLIVYVWKQTPQFFNVCGIDRDEVKELIPHTNHKYISEKYNINFKINRLQINAFKDMGVSNQPGDTKELNKPFSKEKDRSIKSNFLQNSFFKKERGDLGIRHCHYSAPLQLKDFYPLSTDDAKNLQTHSGREFSLNAMNEILLDMSKRVKDRWFKSKKGFLSYMSLVFKHEMRDAVRVSGTNFKIRANQTAEEKTIRQQEEFLSQIEYSLQVSPEWHLKKKLCSVLEREKAYNLLRSYKCCRKEGNNFKIYLTQHCQLTEKDRDIILNQIKASHDEINLAALEGEGTDRLEIIMPEKNLNPGILRFKEQRSVAVVPKKDIGLVGIWGKIREAIIDFHGPEGKVLDQAWFSKLEPEVDDKQKTIKLKAPSNFYRDWIQTNYANVIDKMARKLKYECILS